MKYAFGEIILVVIGILIALQINNWNEDRKANNFEIKMLKEIKLALIDDSLHLHHMLDRMSRLDDNSKYFVDYIAEGNTYNDSLGNKMFGLNIGAFVHYNKGPYEAMKSSGIDKVSNDSLRNSLIEFYDFLAPRFISLIEHYSRNYSKDVDQIVQLQQNPEFIITDGKSKIIQDFSKDVFTKPEFLRILRSTQFRSRSVMATINDFLPKACGLITQIDDVIDL